MIESWLKLTINRELQERNDIYSSIIVFPYCIEMAQEWYLDNCDHWTIASFNIGTEWYYNDYYERRVFAFLVYLSTNKDTWRWRRRRHSVTNEERRCSFFYISSRWFSICVIKCLRLSCVCVCCLDTWPTFTLLCASVVIVLKPITISSSHSCQGSVWRIRITNQSAQIELMRLWLDWGDDGLFLRLNVRHPCRINKVTIERWLALNDVILFSLHCHLGIPADSWLGEAVASHCRNFRARGTREMEPCATTLRARMQMMFFGHSSKLTHYPC